MAAAAQQQAQPPGVSLVQDYGVHASHCGYCGSAAGSVSHGMSAESLSVECYQELLDRGWRRSGCWLYRPLHHRTCCQLTTIRLDVRRYQPSRDQRRVRRRWEAYLAGGPMPGQHAAATRAGSVEQQGQQQRQQGAEGLEAQPQAPAQQGLAVDVDRVAQALVTAGGAAAAAVGSPREQPQGGSPKRSFEEVDAGWPPAAGTAEPASTAAHQWQHQQQAERAEAASRQQASQQLGGGGKRARGGESGQAAAEAGAEQPQVQVQQHQEQSEPSRAPSLVTQFKTVQLQALQQHPQQQQQQQQRAAAGNDAEATTLAAALAAALAACVAAGELPPSAPYPPPRVQQPSAKQRKALPAGVQLTSPFALAVSAAATKCSGGTAGTTVVSASSNGASPAQATAAALLARLQLPAHMQAAALNGHINFSCSGSQSGELAAVSAADATAAMQQEQRRQAGAPVAAPGGKRGAGGGASQGANGSSGSATAGAPVAAIPRGVPRVFELRLLPSEDPNLTAVEFPLFKHYQVVHHGDEPQEVTPKSFQRFLCDTPLRRVGPEQYPPGGCPPCGFGSFHQQYWLDGVLVAVGVVDVLPRCLSSKYLFWDPDMGPLSLGKLTSLKEIDWVREASASCPSLHYYYLGFYLHTCHRMRYKGDFAPSDLLCPRHQCWVPLDRVLPALEAAPPGTMVSLADLPGALEGLGEEHRVRGGRPAAPPRRPTPAELDSLQLVVGGGRIRRGGGRRGGMLVTVGQLRATGALVAGTEARMEAQLGDWAEQAGSEAWSQTALII